MNDLVSVIIPVYKVEKWLNQCVDSVLSQTYEKLEIILVDDGSPDKCPQMCDAYALKDTRVKVIHKSNGGLSSARNAGLDIAQGEYIAFIDSDDYIHPQMMENMLDAIKKTQADIALCGLKRVNEAGHELPKDKTMEDLALDGVLSRQELFGKICGLYEVYCVVAWNKLYNRRLWMEYRYPEGKIHEDEFAVHNILSQCEKIVCIERKYYYYRQRMGSITGEKLVRNELDALEAFLERLLYFEKMGLTECMLLQDIRCFARLRRIYEKYPVGKDMERYKQYQKKYYQLHGRIIKRIHYPVVRRIIVRIYLYFPKAVISIWNFVKKLEII